MEGCCFLFKKKKKSQTGAVNQRKHWGRLSCNICPLAKVLQLFRLFLALYLSQVGTEAFSWVHKDCVFVELVFLLLNHASPDTVELLMRFASH